MGGAIADGEIDPAVGSENETMQIVTRVVEADAETFQELGARFRPVAPRELP